MTFRCKACHAAVWVQPNQINSRSVTVSCPSCEQTYGLKGSKMAHRSVAARARREAEERGLDLPSAYSLVLGVATEAELSEMGSSGSTVCRTPPGEDRPRGRYDSAYESAIRQGLLTPRQAAERGSRSTYAAILASRHGLTEAASLDVADNRISLLQAIRARAKAGRTVQMKIRGRGLKTAALTAILAVSALIVALAPESGTRRVLGTETRQTIGEAEIRTDSSRRITQVRGSSPASVLRAYCASESAGGTLVPLDVVPSPRPGDGVRLGLLRDPRRPSALLAIRIREDRKSGVWLAGEGGAPLIAESAPEGAESAVRHK